MRMRGTISEENMRKMLTIALMEKMENKALVVAPMMMWEHVRGLTLTPRVKMVPMMMLKHVTLPTPRMKVRSGIILYYIRSTRSMPLRLVKIHILILVLILILVEVVCVAALAQIKVIRGEGESVQL
ncbi:hypothetical protein H5410_021838 [Solanum commersonii]|uniref:Uncharacterized protein n=1 Tax=Solanum commersonii TaxID=4109 RepID=A0A9J5ZDN9_SOLCO|nr:hypothetical protein H5410_021838 [Solanum commersonii]